MRHTPARPGWRALAVGARARVLAALALLALAAGCAGSPGGDLASPGVATGDAALARLSADHASGAQVEGAGVVVRLLADDALGDRHQRFILRLDSGQTLLIAHNIDIAPRVEGLQVGDRVAFRGVYEWNREGGTVHWTHHDPSGEHPAGWLRHDGRTVQ